MTPRPVSLLVVSPRAIVSAGVTAMLRDSPGIDVHVGGPGDLRHRPRVALIHLGATGFGALDLEILTPPTTSVIGLTDSQHPMTDVVDGVASYVDLGCATEDLRAAVLAAAELAAAARAPRGQHALISALSPREFEILLAITRGLSNHDIANELYLGVNTVKTYIRSAYRRIGARNRSHAILWCVRNGLLAHAESVVPSLGLAPSHRHLVTPREPGRRSGARPGVPASGCPDVDRQRAGPADELVGRAVLPLLAGRR
ncbi:response regulator transcription factor [Nocardioides dongxiaopingii]|uniref:response regulator transcription factor n=1 Tax=Nocardioides TaxID=1839 RepID=UPI0010C76BE5|nr:MULTISPECIES: response regulator transcription factor [Nocardioides]QCW49289.1 response regulator transcription factor [Nocardioides sp. S-1144]